MTDDLRIRNYATRTIETYIGRVARFAQHFGRSPERLGPEHIRSYQLFLIEEKKASWAVFNQTVCALRFLYETTLGRADVIQHIPFPKQPRKLPVVLSVDEVERFLQAVSNLKHRTVLETMYASGVRLSEALNLRVGDLDSSRSLIRVEQGKGRKDRYTLLSSTLLERLRDYWKRCRPSSYLFPGQRADQPLSPTVIQRACPIARLEARISKRVTTHTMRHCFATHLLEAGVDLRTIQVLMGHGSLNTTARYLHIVSGAVQSRRGAVDLLQAAHAKDPSRP
ncbi:MAG: tyrosine-type recombinase/integrase [Myxococcota bacterium]